MEQIPWLFTDVKPTAVSLGPFRPDGLPLPQIDHAPAQARSHWRIVGSEQWRRLWQIGETAITRPRGSAWPIRAHLSSASSISHPWRVYPKSGKLLTAMSLKNCAVLLGAAGLLAAQSDSSVLGAGWGLDHVLIGLPSLETAKDIFGAKLGFSVRPGNQFPEQGLAHAIMRLPPAYIEVLWPYQKPSKTPSFAAAVRQKAESGGGVASYNIDVSPIERAADEMRRLGLKVTLPPNSVVRTLEGKEQPGAWQFLEIDPAVQAVHLRGVPGGAGVSFLEYRNNADNLKAGTFERMRQLAERDVPDPRRAAGEIHANTGRKLLSVWVAVPSVSEAVRQSEQFGFTAGAARDVEALGEKGREVQCGQGAIVFFAPMDGNSALSQLVKEQGLGPFGFSVAVANLQTAQKIAEQGMNTRFAIQRAGNRISFVVPARLAAGTFVEFVQQ